MANYATLKAAINQYITTNGNNEITGAILNNILDAMVDSLGANYGLGGVATPSTNPGTPDQNVFYLAFEAGTYTNFNNTVLPAGISTLMWNGSWTAQTWYTIDAKPTYNSNNFVKSGGVYEELALGAVYDVTAHNSGATFASLSALLSNANLSTLIPTSVRKGGMSIKYVQSSDNKYVQFRLMKNTWSTTVSDWQGVDDVPKAKSKNLVESGGVNDAIVMPLKKVASIIDKELYSKTRGYIIDSGIKTMPGGNLYVYEIPVEADQCYIVSNVSIPYDYSYTYMIVDQSDNILKRGIFLVSGQTSSGEIVTIPTDGVKLYVTSNVHDETTQTKLYKIETNELIQDLQENLNAHFQFDITLEHGDGSSTVDLTKRIDILPETIVNLRCVQYHAGNKAIIFYDSLGVELSSITLISGGGNYAWLSGTAPAGTSYVVLNYRETSTRLSTKANLVYDIQALNNNLLATNSFVDEHIDVNTDITLEHGDGTSVVNFTKRVEILPYTIVNLRCLQFSTNVKAIIFYNKNGVELASVKHKSQSGNFQWISGTAPINTSYMVLNYRESNYSGSYGGSRAKLTNYLNSVYYSVLEIINKLEEVPSYSKDITLEHGDGSSTVDLTKRIDILPKNVVNFYCLQYYAGNKAIIFYDELGTELSSVKLISGGGQNAWISGTAPDNTAYVELIYRENTYAGSYGQTKARIISNLESVNDEVIKLNAKNINAIVFNGDSTGQGLDGNLNPSMFNNQISIKRGSVGSENVFATAARQGGIPMIVLPFTIPANSTMRWSNGTNSIVAAGDDPQVVYSSSLLFHTEYDEQGIPETPSVSEYTKLHFSPNSPFACYINGVKGVLYSLPHYHVEGGQVIIDGEGHPDMYFHRSEAGEQVVIDKVTEVIPSIAKDWRDSYQVNLMGTNQGFQTYKNQDYVLLGDSFDDLINAMDGSTTAEKAELAFKEAAHNLFDIQKRMSRNAKDYLVIGFFCEVSTSIFHKTFYEEYENLCDRYFGNHFFNARLYLKDQAWKDLGITLTNADRANIAIGLPPWSLFNADGQPSGNPHLTTAANKALANQVALRIAELGWVESYPNLIELS